MVGQSVYSTTNTIKVIIKYHETATGFYLHCLRSYIIIMTRHRRLLKTSNAIGAHCR